ncbi:MAG TPA: hypothetical protein ENJ88_04265 [Phaeodactylibacter sp.]|nr:hypothetical protein [Phaeodactylibacter sp.]
MKWFRRKTCEHLYCDDFWLRVIGIPLLGGLMPLVFFGFDPWSDAEAYGRTTLVTIAAVGIFWHFDRGVVIYFRKHFPDLSDYFKRLIYQVAIIIPFSVVFLLFVDRIVLPLVRFDVPAPPMKVQILATLILTVMIAAVYEAIYGFVMWRNSLLENERLKKERAEALFLSLNNQLKPHFLFNSLNTLVALIPQDGERAVEFTQQLAFVYRFLLNVAGQKSLIPLREEWRLVQAFVHLWENRFGEGKINISFEVPDVYMDRHLPPLSLQMLCENAVKHNEVSREHPLFIRIRVEDDYLVVSNNLQERKQVRKNGKGLENIRRRYRLLSNREVKIERGEETFSVALPLLSVASLV